MFTGPHKPTDTAQAVVLMQQLLGCMEDNWAAITTSCVVPWIPEHDAQLAELPPEAAELKSKIAELHGRCLSSAEFIAAIEHQARCLTPIQVEKLQVLLYTTEDFEFADFLHLTIFHTSNRFAESPLGISPRSWDCQPPAEPILLTPVHHFLPVNYTAARNHISRREKRRCKVPVPVKPEVQPVAEAEIKLATSPQMEKWLKMMQTGGLPRRKASNSAFLRAKAHQRYMAAHAPKRASLRHTQPRQQPEPCGDQQTLPELAVGSCRPRDALLRAWDKVFPGEEKDIVPASRLCFTGLQGSASQQNSCKSQARLSASLQPQQMLGKLSSMQQLPGNSSEHNIKVQASQANAGSEDQRKGDGAASLHRVSEAPEDFSNRQLTQMQQRHQELLQHRLAALPSIQPCSSTAKADSNSFSLPHGRASPNLPQSLGRASPNSFQVITDREPVADSPITLFSLGSPYSSSSPWCSSAALPLDTTSSPSEWAKLMAVKSMVGSVPASKASRASPLSQEGSGAFPKGPFKGILSRASSSVPPSSGSEAVSKSGTAVPAVAKSGKRAVFSKDALRPDRAAMPEPTRKGVGGKIGNSPAAVQSSDDETASALSPLSKAAEEGFDRPNAAAQDQEAPQDKLHIQSSLEGSVDATDSSEDNLSRLPHSGSYVFRRSMSSVKQQRNAVPAASPLSRVVTYRPEMLRSAASAYQSAEMVLGTSQNRVQESMWEDSPVVATLRQSGMTVEQREKQDEFVAQLGQWYKEQLQRRVPSRTAELRAG